MSHPDAYRTVESIAEGDYRERGSKFLGYLYPCRDEAELKKLVDGLRKMHPGARHVCYAAVMGSIDSRERINDDGEPGGTAGLPILNQLLSAGLRNVALLVVRYFGGSKLGKPGLILAYKSSAEHAIQAADILVRYNRIPITFKFHYDATGVVMQAIERIPHAEIIGQQFDQEGSITVMVPRSEVPEALRHFDHSEVVKVQSAED